MEKYIDFMSDKLDELAIEDISYSDYDQMTDWLGEITKQVTQLEEKQEPMKPVDKETEYACGQCDTHVAYKYDYCWKCGQKLDWED